MLEKAVWSIHPDMRARGTPEEAILSATEHALIWQHTCSTSVRVPNYQRVAVDEILNPQQTLFKEYVYEDSLIRAAPELQRRQRTHPADL